MSGARSATTEAATTRAELVAAYLEHKARVLKSGAVRRVASNVSMATPEAVRDMTDEAQAGLWLHVFGDAALREFDMAARMRPRNLWPRARDLIVAALGVAS